MQNILSKIIISIFLSCVFLTAFGQPNKKLKLVHFNMPAVVPANGSFTVSGYVKNIGNGTTPAGALLHAKAKSPGNSTNPADFGLSWIESDLSTIELGKIHAGDSLYVEQVFEATPGVFTPGASNIVIIWPTSQITDNEEDSKWERMFFVNNGNNNSLVAGENNGISTTTDRTDLQNNTPGRSTVQFIVPEQKKQDAFIMECYDASRQLFVQKYVTDHSSRIFEFELMNLTIGERYAVFLKDASGNILSKIKIIRMD